jgi:ribonuclease Z
MRKSLHLALMFVLWAGVGGAKAADLHVHLIGTGGPELTPERAGMSTLIDVDGRKFLFDVGRGALQNIYLSRIHPNEVTKVFLTHLHNDHFEGLSELWLTPWFLLGRDHGFDLWGPEGTGQMVTGMRAMFGHDLEKRVNKFNPIANLDIKVHPLAEGVVFFQAGVKVTAFPVEHDDGNPAYGYRIDHDGHSVLLSGDTTLNDNVIKYGANADVIIHNVIAFSQRLSELPEMKGVLAKLTTPEQAAEVFKHDAPKMAVFSHVVTKELNGAKGLDELVARTRAAGYTGPLTMGQDRMVINIGEAIEIVPPPSLDDLPDLDSKLQVFP